MDDMEASYVIQKVPSSFIKALSSTNLQPKDAGKTGATRVEVLRMINAECIRAGLAPQFEEVREDGESNEQMLDAVERSKDGEEKKTKW